jgi:hypothetical protein
MAEKPTTPKTLFLPDIPALEKDRKEVIAKTRAAEKTIETKNRLVKERQEKIASIDRRIERIQKLPSTPSTLFHPDISQLLKDKKKLSRQIKADQTTVKTKTQVVKLLKEKLALIEEMTHAIPG